MASKTAVQAAVTAAEVVENSEKAVETVTAAVVKVNPRVLIAVTAGVALTAAGVYVVRRVRKASKTVEAEAASVSE